MSDMASSLEKGRYPASVVTDDGWGVIMPGHGLDRAAVAAALAVEVGPIDATTMHVQEWDVTYVPRVKHCSRYDGFGCDNEGEWHGHWFPVKPGKGTAFTVAHACPLPSADMCHNGHPFEPGQTVDDAPGESHPDWCNVCGEARVLPSDVGAP